MPSTESVQLRSYLLAQKTTTRGSVSLAGRHLAMNGLSKPLGNMCFSCAFHLFIGEKELSMRMLVQKCEKGAKRQ